jgi:hypothetical protein
MVLSGLGTPPGGVNAKNQKKRTPRK